MHDVAQGKRINCTWKNDYGGAMELPEIIVGVVILGIFALWVVAAIWAFKQIRLAIKTKTVSAKLAVAVLVLVYVAYTNIKSFLL
jgi:hypothetical protein